MKTIKVLILLFFTVNVYSQKYISVSNWYADKKSINKIVKDYAKEEKKLLIYQPSLETLDFTSLLLVSKGKSVRFWKIKNDTILNTGKIRNDSIFSYRHFLKTGVRVTEDKLKFVPPLSCCNIIIYIDSKRSFYFEDENTPVTYSPDENYQKYRIEWRKIIKNEIEGIINN
ncbi:hypothetical protein [Bacteroides sedimenti]|uniref:DUF4468 domain-containing protein n=1 Tax=Bacteroides sedimenti TaxID=2136147 RepID=A0ABM8IFW8_9BACE